MNDLISRQTALRALEEINYALWEIDIPSPTVPEYIEHHEQVQKVMTLVDEWARKLIAMPNADQHAQRVGSVGDLISRAALFNALANVKTIEEAFAVIQGMPAAERYTESELQKMQELEAAEIQKAYELGREEGEPRWIPCTERLPEPKMAVLGYAPKYQNIFAVYYDSAYGWMIWSPIRDDCFPNSQGEITAWCPLPRPWKGEE